MFKSFKKISFILMSMALAFQLGLSPFQSKNVYALGDVEIFGEKVDFYIEETPIKRIVTSVMENGQKYSCEYIKSTGKAYMNDHEIEYSFTKGTSLTEENHSIKNNLINSNYELYASTSPWTAETIVKGYHIDFAPLINAAGGIAAVGTQLYTGMIGVSAASLIEKLAKATLKKHWAVFANFCGDTLIDTIGANASKIVNATFTYDLQKTKGLVDLTGSGVKVYAYRYANYTSKVKVLGKTFTKNTGKYGGWWSSSKPYSIELPESDY